jgi:hypothetical protein
MAEMKSIQYVGYKTLKRITQLEGLGTRRRVLLKTDVKLIGFQDVNWIHPGLK